MPKKSDQLAGGFDSENTGGLLTGLLAEEENFDRRAMLRLGTWGVVSVGAVIVAVLANQSAIKTRRDEVAALDLTRQSMQIQAIARESQSESRRLASAIDTLNTDRDRLFTRLAGVEQGLDSVTGAIARQKAVPAPSPSAAPPPVAASQSPAAPSNAPASDPAPVVGPVATTAAPAAERARAEARKSAQAALIAAAPPAPSPVPSPAPVTTSAMPVMPRSMMAPPDPAAPKLIAADPPAKPITTIPAPAPSPAPAPPQTAAAAGLMPQVTASPIPAPGASPVPDKTAALDKNAAAATAPIEVKRTEFGVDVGGANSVAGLRALWRGLLKYRSNAPLAAMQPIIVVKEASNGLGMQLRLVAGPLSDAAAAAKICASIGSRDRPCETTVYDGQKLAVKADDGAANGETISARPAEKPAGNAPAADKADDKPAAQHDSAEPAAEKPATKPGSNRYFHRRSSFVATKRTAAVTPPPPVVEEPAKPEQSGLSSFFSRVHPQQQPQQ